MIRTRIAFGMLVIILILAEPVLSGSYLTQGPAIAWHRFKSQPDEYISAEFLHKYVESGSSTQAMMRFECNSDFPSKTTDFVTDLTTRDAYFTGISGVASQRIIQDGKEPTNKLVNLKTYIIMPNKFDSIQTYNVQFLDEDPSHAELNATFTYNDRTYTFLKDIEIKEGENELNLFLQPFCSEFEGLGIETEKTFQESFSTNGLDIEGSLSMEAVKL
jgi:hypothetical protein